MPGVSAVTPAEPLRALPDAPPESPGSLDALQAFVEAESQQRRARLLAAFALINASGKRLDLLNPLDLLQWQLLDDAGAPVALPERPPNLRVHRPAGEPWRLNSAIPVASVTQDGAATDAAMLDSPALGLEPEARLAVTFAFDLPSGSYRLAALATLIDARDTSSARVLRSEPLAIRFERAADGE